MYYQVSGKTAVQGWYDEISMHQYGTESFSMSTGHFTQVVWKESIELGMAKATSINGQTIVVANYSPPGNYAGKFTRNVLPPQY